MTAPAPSSAPVDVLAAFVEKAANLVVLTGAGCSTESGIPDYRDRRGEWKRPQPMYLQEFVGSAEARRRYWAGSFLGWPTVASAHPNAAHSALARLEGETRLAHLITQNVDGLHQKAGSRNVIDLHGRLDQVECMACEYSISREHFQTLLEKLNRRWEPFAGTHPAPDGDTALAAADYEAFRIAACPSCEGVLKPSVVFFGESVPKRRVAAAMARLEQADALLVVGSSLMVFSGYRFVRRALERRVPVAAINVGRTRADDEISLKVEQRCSDTLVQLLHCLGLGRP